VKSHYFLQAQGDAFGCEKRILFNKKSDTF
jgi:hypothetical protein